MIKLTLETRTEINMAFSSRRRELLRSWVSAYEAEMAFGFGPVYTFQWANNIQSLNDAEAELLAAIDN
jgi:hypothetical protein